MAEFDRALGGGADDEAALLGAERLHELRSLAVQHRQVRLDEAAELLGLPFSFAHHFAGGNTLPALAAYRRRFRPSEALETPYVMLGVNVVCAETEERARWLAGPGALAFLRLRSGRPGRYPSPEEAAEYTFTPAERHAIAGWAHTHVVGDPESVMAQLGELVELGRTSSVPRMLAVERFPSLSDALARDLEQPEPVTIDGPVQARSISDAQGTAMAVHALRTSGGHAVSADDQEIRASWARLAVRGHLMELSSAAALCGVQSLVDTDALTDGSTIVMVGTAGPYAQQTLGEAGAQRRVEDPADAAALEAAAAEQFAS